MEGFLGEIRAISGDVIPQGWLPCDGRLLNVSGNEALFSILGWTFGGAESVFAIPDLRGRAAVQPGTVPGTSRSIALGETDGSVGETLPIGSGDVPILTANDNRQPFLGLNFVICVSGEFPATDTQ